VPTARGTSVSLKKGRKGRKGGVGTQTIKPKSIHKGTINMTYSTTTIDQADHNEHCWLCDTTNCKKSIVEHVSGITLTEIRDEATAYFEETNYEDCLLTYLSHVIHLDYVSDDALSYHRVVDYLGHPKTDVFDLISSYVSAAEYMGVDSITLIAELTPILDPNANRFEE
jgi:hypothetical protein